MFALEASVVSVKGCMLGVLVMSARRFFLLHPKLTLYPYISLTTFTHRDNLAIVRATAYTTLLPWKPTDPATR
jgi:hypothetical protein